jgi:hypothetical protein
MWMEVEEEGQMAYNAIICKKALKTKVETQDECLDKDRGETQGS